jgi:hypothetical protein
MQEHYDWMTKQVNVHPILDFAQQHHDGFTGCTVEIARRFPPKEPNEWKDDSPALAPRLLCGCSPPESSMGR